MVNELEKQMTTTLSASLMRHHIIRHCSFDPSAHRRQFRHTSQRYILGQVNI
jgi:hypothetical protein